MKGFLHRIAASALGVEPRVHPLVEPLYSPRAQQISQPSPELSMERTAPVFDTLSSFSATGFRDTGEANNALSAKDTLHDGERSVASNENRTRQQRHQAGRNELASQEAHIQPSHLPESTSVSAWGFVPIVAAHNAPQAASDPAFGSGEQTQSRAFINKPKAPLRPPRRRDNSALPGGSAQPDEIQIHIGRIEVLAVPPPATSRSAASPARKGLSLDEYLRRKNGRVG